MRPTFPRYPYGEYLVCERCGHGWAPAPAPVALALQRKSFGDEFAGRAGPLLDHYERGNDARALAALRRACVHRVLEVGPGSGSLMARLHANGAEVVGVDVSDSVANAIDRRHGLPVTTEPLADFAAKHRGAFDCVVLRHVLEHFADPRTALAAAAEALAPRGTLYLAVPTAASWHRRFPAWTGYQPYHFHYFSPRSLSALAKRSGFEVERLSTYEPPTGWPNTAYRTLRGAARLPRHSSTPRARRLLEMLRLGSGLAISPVRWLQSALGAGEELVLVARRAVP